MSQEVRITLTDYKIILSWYDRLFGKDSQKKPNVSDTIAYQKMLVMNWALAEEMEEQKD